MPLTTAAASLIGAGINALGSVVSNRQSYKKTEQLMKKQQQMNLSNWNMQNKYNSPASQMARLRSAGLNPNLIYANGGSFTGAGEIASPSVNQFDYQDPFAAAGQGFASVGSAYANMNNLQAATENLQVTKDINKILKQMNEKELGYKDRFLYQQLLGNNMKILLDHQTANELESKTGLNRRELDTYYLRLQNTLDNDRVQRDLGRASISEIQKHIDEINAVISKTHDEQRLMRLEYARGMIAKTIEEFVRDYKLGDEYVEKKYTDENGRTTKIVGYKQKRLERMLNNEIDRIETEILGNEIHNISDPINDIIIPIGAAWLLGRQPGRNPIGFKKR